MAVLVQAVTVIIVNAVVEQRFPGGLQAFAQMWSGPVYCTDGRISAVAFMTSEDAGRFTTMLGSHGFADPWTTSTADIAVVVQGKGLVIGCDWLRVERGPLDERTGAPEVTVAQMAGEELATFSAPAGWDARMWETLTPLNPDEYELQGSEHHPGGGGEVLTYRHKATGALRYVGRPDIPADDTQARYEQLWRELIELETSPASRSRDERLAVVAADCNRLLAASDGIEPRWLYLQGIAARLRGQWRQAEHAFGRLTALQPNSLPGWLELTGALGKLDRLPEAEAAARSALAVDPGSPAAHGNLASALHQQGNTPAAMDAIRFALTLDPSNAINQQIFQRVQESMDNDKALGHPQGGTDQDASGVPWYKRLFR